MKVNGKNYKTIWMEGEKVKLIDQNLLPFRFEIIELENWEVIWEAIVNMNVRGAGAIGVAAGYAMALAFIQSPQVGGEEYLWKARQDIEQTRPTARDLFYATERVMNAGIAFGTAAAIEESQRIAFENEEEAKAIAIYGESLMLDTCNVLTHCNAGWLGFVDWGSALAPIYLEHRNGKKIFVYVDETRPRLQGSRLTAWELQNEGIPHVIVADNAGAWLLSNHKVDLLIMGADRIALNGDTANKIGTFEKAIVAKNFGVPFYVAAPLSTFDPSCPDGSCISIEHRPAEEITQMEGLDENDHLRKIRISSPGSKALNPAFDVTPSSYIHSLITSKGIIQPNNQSIRQLLLG